MTLDFNQIVSKFLDNANIGKVVTDVLPGVALGLALMMLFTVWTGSELLPVQSKHGLEAKLRTAEARLETSKDNLRASMAEVSRNLNAARSEAGETRSADDLIDVTTITLDQLNQKAAAAETALLEMKPYSQTYAHLGPALALANGKRAEVDRIQKQIADLNTKLLESNSFAGNIAAITANLSAVLGLGVLLGIIISQMNRLLVVEILFNRFLGLGGTGNQIGLWIAGGEISEEDRQALVTEYYRYAEGAMNMVWPLLFLAWIVPAYLQTAFPLYEKSPKEMEAAAICTQIALKISPTATQTDVAAGSPTVVVATLAAVASTAILTPTPTPSLTLTPTLTPTPGPQCTIPATTSTRDRDWGIRIFGMLAAVIMLWSSKVTYQRFVEKQREVVVRSRPPDGFPHAWLDPKPPKPRTIG